MKTTIFISHEVCITIKRAIAQLLSEPTNSEISRQIIYKELKIHQKTVEKISWMAIATLLLSAYCPSGAFQGTAKPDLLLHRTAEASQHL